MPAQLDHEAPEFSAQDQQGAWHALKDEAGKWVLLYFYPKDDTPGCTKEACGFRDAFHDLATRVTIFGVSGDTIESHKKFAQKYELPFPLLADPDHHLLSSYGTDGSAFNKRTSFLIDPEGIIRKIYENIDTETHAAQILQDLEVLQ